MKKILAAVMACVLLLSCAMALADVTARSYGTTEGVYARPNQKLALRSGPGTKYSELFSIAASGVEDFMFFWQEKGGSVMWGMVEFECRYGRYRAYTGMKRIDVNKNDITTGNSEGVMCAVGRDGAYAYYGPGRYYAPVETKVPAWTEIVVYHEEGGWVMADFVLPGAKDNQYDKNQKQLTRAWIPVDALTGYISADEYWFNMWLEEEGYDWEDVG
ncbi:MAG: hypothetical protein IKU34_09425 [Clostridia bacterium]|nr:hypothetical protein [Clostridia bacterium]